MATFTVLNGTGIDSNNDFIGDGVKFGQLSQIAASGTLLAPIVTPIFANIFFLDTGSLTITGTGMAFDFLTSTFSGTADGLTYSKFGAGLLHHRHEHPARDPRRAGQRRQRGDHPQHHLRRGRPDLGLHPGRHPQGL